MNRFAQILIFAAFGILVQSCRHAESENASFVADVANLESKTTSKTPKNSNIERLVAAYPMFLENAEGNFVIWKDGTRMLWDDGRSKTASQREDAPDLEDMFQDQYFVQDTLLFVTDYDPGRVRNEAFFKKMYGENAAKVAQNLETITWLPSLSREKIQVTRINGVDKALAAVSDDLSELGKSYIAYLKPLGGTFNWRKIAGTERLSVHSFGAAIDINVKFSNYWRWSAEFKAGKPLVYHNQIPFAIVEIFQKHGFIWGGKWYHYDTMHFEYRPELL